MTIAERTKFLRTEGLGKKMSRREFAEPMGISEGTIQNIEESRYKGEVPESTLNLICKTYNVQYRWLTKGEGEMIAHQDSDALVEKYMEGETALAKSIMKAFAKLPDEEWIKFRDLLERIKKESD